MDATPQEEDVKPKLTLTISLDHNSLMVKVKPEMKFAKIFEAAEKRFESEPDTLRFIYDGKRIGKDDTPAILGMEDGDQIDVFLGQVGGNRS